MSLAVNSLFPMYVKLAHYSFILEIYKFTVHAGLALFNAKEPHQLI